MKKYIVGFLVGVVVSVGAVGVFAETMEYTLTQYSLPVYINNVKYPSDALPVLSLNLNGGDNTYVPLRNFSEMMGADVNYDREAGRIDITTDFTSTATETPTTSTKPNDNASITAVENTNKENNNNKNKDKDKNKDKNKNTSTTTENTEDSTVTTPVSLSSLTKTYNDTYKLNVYSVNGVDYVDSDEIDNFYFDDDYKADNDEYEFEDYDKRGVTSIDLDYNDTVSISAIPVLCTTDDDHYLITLDYFVNNIYPTIK